MHTPLVEQVSTPFSISRTSFAMAQCPPPDNIGLKAFSVSTISDIANKITVPSYTLMITM